MASHDEPTAKKSRKCPKCGKNTLDYSPHVAVLTRTIAKKRAKKGLADPKDRLTYEPAWLCKNVACRYLRLIDE